MMQLQELGPPNIPRRLLSCDTDDTSTQQIDDARIQAYEASLEWECIGTTDQSTSDARPSPVEQFLEAVYHFQDSGGINAGIDYIFWTLNRWLCGDVSARRQGRPLCNAVLACIDVSKLKTDLLLSFLTITKAHRERLPKRAEYRGRAWKRIAQLDGRAMAEKLLGKEAE